MDLVTLCAPVILGSVKVGEGSHRGSMAEWPGSLCLGEASGVTSMS